MDTERDEKNLVLLKIPAPLLLQRTEARKPWCLDSERPDLCIRRYAVEGKLRLGGKRRVATADGGGLPGSCGGDSFPMTIGLERGNSRTEPDDPSGILRANNC